MLYVMSQTYYFVHCMLCLLTNQKIKRKLYTFSLVSCDKLTLVLLICDINIQRQTLVMSNFLYIKVFTQVPWASIYPSFTVYIFYGCHW